MSSPNSNEIDINRALRRRKTLRGQIEKKLSEKMYGIRLYYPESSKGPAKHSNKLTLECFESLLDQISYYNKLDGAIAVNNSITKIKITKPNGKIMEMSRYEAIKRKENIDHEKKLYRILRNQLIDAKYNQESEEKEFNRKLNDLLIANFGKDGVKNNPEEVELITKNFRKSNPPSVIETIWGNEEEFEKKLSEKEKELELFMEEIDSELTNSNAKSLINPYEDAYYKLLLENEELKRKLAETTNV